MAGLSGYRAKRASSRTEEPRCGDVAAVGGAGGIFVIHKHAASRLHYDLRLEQGGVLWSWAVTRGPSLDPAEKRLAVHVGDHPLDYAGFEGTIPEGEYGGGAVIVWDEGRWRPEGDPEGGMREGRLRFSLQGQKLRGFWHLVRMRARRGERRDNWLLIKDDDAAARRDGDVLEEEPKSVRSGRTIEEVAGKPTAAPEPRRAGKKSAPKAETEMPETVAGDPVTLTHPEKLLWPEAGISKRDLLDHYQRVWERLESFLVGRPLTLVRAPDGKKRFFQQHAWAGMPRNIRRIRDPADGAELLFVEDFDGLAALVQFGTVEIHGWGAKTDALVRPDQVVFDLDPDEGIDMKRLREGALEVRGRLEAAGFSAFVKTSGGKGFHVVAPLAGEAEWEAVESFASSVAQGMAADAPARFTASSAKAERIGRIYVDYLRNNPNATTVLVWSSRAKPEATISVPLTWEALEKGAGPADFALGNAALKNALKAKDPWADFRNAAKPLPA